MTQYEVDLAEIRQAIAELTEGQQEIIKVIAHQIRFKCEMHELGLLALALVGAEYAAKPEVEP
jgi:hypothetical protein